ncbi:MAG: glycosyltransferase [Acidobacteriota bacterium]|nr:glycosyltransferase [Acidobacteriota bacterium]
MHLVIFGLTISSSWGNGHATLWRSLVKAMLQRGHTVTFYEKDVPYYAGARDLYELPRGGTLRFYSDFDEVRDEAKRTLRHADLALCTSFCPDGAAASEVILGYGRGIRAFYDLDTPVTLNGLKISGTIDYMPVRGLGDFDLVLSYTGGRALGELKSRLGARVVAPLYGSVDPESYKPAPMRHEFQSALSYLGTYAADRQQTLTQLLLEPAKLAPKQRFLIGGAQYPESFPWGGNIFFVRHVPPPMHPAFFCSGRATLNVTRGVMARYGFCPSGRLFEAAATGTPLLTDDWEGLDSFFTPGREILRVSSAADVANALSLSDRELSDVAEAGRARTLSEHTGAHRVKQLEQLCDGLGYAPAQNACSAREN